MITDKFLKETAREENKKISSRAMKKIEDNLKREIKKIIKDASINADFESRKIIKEEDI